MTRVGAMRGRCVVLCAALTVAGGAAGAQSQCASQAEADGLEERGNALRLQQQDREALVLFQQSYALCHGARARLRIGLAEAALGRWLEAEGDVTEALSHGDDPWITANRTSAQAQLATIGRHLGNLELLGDGGPAEVWVGNQRVATWPMQHPVRVLAGTVSYSVRAEGFETVSRVVEVTAGGLAREHVELVQRPVAAPAPTVPAVTRTSDPARSPGNEAPRVAPPAPARGSTQRTVAWITAIGGGLGVAGGVAALLARESQVSSFGAQGCFENNGALEGPTTCRDLYDTANTLVPVEIAAFAVGGALAATSLVLWVTAPSRRETPRVAFGCAPSTRGVVCAGTW